MNTVAGRTDNVTRRRCFREPVAEIGCRVGRIGVERVWPVKGTFGGIVINIYGVRSGQV